MLHGWPFIHLRNVFAILYCFYYVFCIYSTLAILRYIFFKPCLTIHTVFYSMQYYYFKLLFSFFWSGCTVWLVDENVNVIFATFYRLQSPAPQDQPEEKEDRDHKLERTRSAGSELLFQFLFKCLIETQYISLKSKWPFVCFMNLISYI